MGIRDRNMTPEPDILSAPPSSRLAQPLSLRANFSWTFVGNMVYAGCQWGMLMVLAKLGTPEMVGQFSLGLAVTAPVIMFANLQLRNVQATDARGDYQFGDYLALRLISTLAALLIIGGLAFASGYQQETLFVILIVGLAKAFEALSDVYYGLFQQRERMDRIAKSMLIKGPFSLAVLGMGVWLTGSIIWGVIGLTVVWGLLLLLFDLHSARLITHAAPASIALRPNWNPTLLLNLAWFALPLGIVRMLIALDSNIPRYFMESYWGETTLGYYSSVAYLVIAGNTVVAALGQSASPRLARYFAEKQYKRFFSLMGKLLGIGVVTGLVAILIAALFGRELLVLLYTAEYANYADFFVWMMCAGLTSYLASFLNYGMTATRHFKPQILLFGSVATVVVSTSYFFIPKYGVYGGAIAIIAGMLTQATGSILVIAHAIRKARA